MNCPNCVTHKNCIGPHLVKSWHGIYNSDDGYFLLNTNTQKYVFIPHEKEYTESNLLNICNTLKVLNENLGIY